MRGFKEFIVESGKPLFSDDEVNRMLANVSHVAQRSEEDRSKDIFRKWIRRFPTHYYEIMEKFKPVLVTAAGRDYLMHADAAIQEALKLLANPELVSKQKFYKWDRRDWLSKRRDRPNELRIIYSRMTPEELKKIDNAFAGADNRYRKYAEDELAARRKMGLNA